MKKLKRLAFALLRNRWAFRLIGIALFVLILLKVDLRQVWQTLLEVDLAWLLLSFVLQFLALGVATIRWQLIMRRLNIHIPLRRTFVHQLIGTAAALVTPGQLGEFVKVLYHRREGVPIPESLLSVVIDRLYDLLMLFLLGFIALAILVGLPARLTIFISVAGAIALVVGLLVTRKREQSRRWLVTQLVRASPKSYKETMRTEAHRLTSHVAQFTLGFLVVSALLTVANYILLVLRAYAVVAAVNPAVPFWYYAMIVPLIRLVGLVPISILGIGTRDVTVIYLLGQVGISQESALLISTIGLIMRPLQALVGLVAWWAYPLREEEKQPVADAVVTVNQRVAERGGG